MGKKKKQEENDEVTYMGESVDPDIQKKVDGYMELSPEELAAEEKTSKSAGKKIDISHESDEEAGTAPLLPTDELPDAVKKDAEDSNKKSKKGKKPVKKEESKEEEASEDEDEKKPDEETDIEKTEETEIEESEDKGDSEDNESDEASDEESTDAENEDENTDSEDESEELAEEDDEKSDEDNEVENKDQENESAEDENTDSEDDSSDDEKDEEEPKISKKKSGALVASATVATEDEVKPKLDAEDLAAPDFKDKTLADMEKLPIEDAETDKAVDEIVAKESDQLLSAEDEKMKKSKPEKVKAKKEKRDIKKFFVAWFKTPLYRNLTILFVALGLVALALVPNTRYFILNTAGVKVSTSIKVLDSKTSLPLKNVELSVANKSAKTDVEGNVKLEGIPLGYQTMVIKKPAFAEISEDVTLGWGSNPLGEYKLNPVGAQYAFQLFDFLSNEPIKKGELTFGEASANFNEKGEAIITVDNVDEDSIDIEVISENYRTEYVTVSTVTDKKYSVAMVPAKKHVYFSNRSGKADLYKSDVDGKNEEVLLVGSGLEKEESLGIAPHPSKDFVAFSSSRQNVRNKDGFLLNTLHMIDINTKEVIKVSQSERIQIVDWIGDKLVYVKIAEGASEANTKRHRLMSFDAITKEDKELASTNYFNDVISVNGAIYYSPALYQVNGKVGLYKINADGSNKKTIFQKEVWNLFRTEFGKVSLSVGQDWFDMNLQNDELTKVGGAPSVLRSRVYIPSPNGQQSAWIDERDGKTVLLTHNHETGKDKMIHTQSGIKNPVIWLDDDHVVYRVSNGQETADYVISLSGGEPKKIVDVLDSIGIDRWYYF